MSGISTAALTAMCEADKRNAQKAYGSPCAEFLRFREMLDEVGIEWWDLSERGDYPMHRTHGNGFSVVYGKFSYGAEQGLLELLYDGAKGVEGWLTAEQAYQMIIEKGLG